jgi:spore coat protein CotH
MEIIKHKTKNDQRVKLKSNGEDSLYRLAGAGSEGWVRKQDKDKYGYPMIYIEWDRLHWTYNGEEDKWTYESHFETVNRESEDMQDFENDDERYQQFLKWLNEQPKDEGKRNEEAEYKELLDVATKEAANSDSFMLFTVDREVDDNGDDIIVPRVAFYFKSDVGGHAIELQLAKMAASAHENIATLVISDLLEAGE